MKKKTFSPAFNLPTHSQGAVITFRSAWGKLLLLLTTAPWFVSFTLFVSLRKSYNPLVVKTTWLRYSLQAIYIYNGKTLPGDECITLCLTVNTFNKIQ